MDGDLDMLKQRLEVCSFQLYNGHPPDIVYSTHRRIFKNANRRHLPVGRRQKKPRLRKLQALPRTAC